MKIPGVSEVADSVAARYMNAAHMAWNQPMGRRKVLAGHLGGGMLLGGALAVLGASVNRARDLENVARYEESSSAYGAGPDAVGVQKKMPHATGQLTMGLHNRRKG